MNPALILIDIQNDYFSGGRNPLEGSLEASRQAARLLAHFRRSALPLIHVKHIAVRPGASFFLPNTTGVEIHTVVQPLDGETVVQKHFPNSFRQTSLLDHLKTKQVRRLVIAGMMTHMCVDASVRAASDLGFEVWLAQDSCATKTLTFAGKQVPAEQVQLSFLAALDGTYARVMSVDQILAELQ